jgi:hypothetical protein
LERVYTYARGCDRRDLEGVAALFQPEGSLVLPGRADDGTDLVFTGRAAIAERLQLLHRSRVTTHFVGNHLATVDGDRGTGETYCLAYHIDGPPDRNYLMSIRYEDAFERTPEGWRFAKRVLHLDWTSTSLLDHDA